jgi:hypothetical protein
LSNTDIDDAERLSRARGYPYAYPFDSYLWRDGAVLPFEPVLRDGRTPVLAFGSNRAPERLQQKFGHLVNQTIPVERASLSDFDVVYAAHITTYGAVPAMLQHRPGVTVDIAVTWLDPDQLGIMHESEMRVANYVYARLDDVKLQLDSGEVETEALCYVGARGHLPSEAQEPHSLIAVRAEGRPHPGHDTHSILESIRTRLAPQEKPDAFVLRLIADREYRTKVTDTISANAVAFSYPLTVLEGTLRNR